MINKIIAFLSLTGLFSLNVEACSTFLLEKEHKPFLAKSYDWIVEDGLVIVNKRHIAKQAMTLDHPMQWVSKYGSVTFTQVGRELPMGGMNEAGLVIELMWLDDTVYPIPDSRPTVNELQWIQYQLDTSSNVEEVLLSDNILRIDPNSKSLLHFFVIDSSGNRAIIEFINGEMVTHTRNEMLVPVLTNNTYKESVEFLKEYQGFGGDKIPLEGYKPLDRFVRISTLLQDDTDPFHILSNVAFFDETPKEKISFKNMVESIRTMWNILSTMFQIKKSIF